MKRLNIIGASGHGKVVAYIAALNGYEDIVFLDDDESKKKCWKYDVIGKSKEAPEGEIFVAVGNQKIREELMEHYKDRSFPTLVHPSAVVAEGVEVGSGTVIMAGAVINPETRIGRGVIINTSSSVDHDCVVEDYVHISVGAHLSGTVSIGKGTWIGAGATVINNVSICSGCLIGAGAVVVKDIVTPGLYLGVPAQKR